MSISLLSYFLSNLSFSLLHFLVSAFPPSSLVYPSFIRSVHFSLSVTFFLPFSSLSFPLSLPSSLTCALSRPSVISVISFLLLLCLSCLRLSHPSYRPVSFLSLKSAVFFLSRLLSSPLFPLVLPLRLLSSFLFLLVSSSIPISLLPSLALLPFPSSFSHHFNLVSSCIPKPCSPLSSVFCHSCLLFLLFFLWRPLPYQPPFFPLSLIFHSHLLSPLSRSS